MWKSVGWSICLKATNLPAPKPFILKDKRPVYLDMPASDVNDGIAAWVSESPSTRKVDDSKLYITGDVVKIYGYGEDVDVKLLDVDGITDIEGLQDSVAELATELIEDGWTLESVVKCFNNDGLKLQARSTIKVDVAPVVAKTLANLTPKAKVSIANHMASVLTDTEYMAIVRMQPAQQKTAYLEYWQHQM